MNFGDKYIWATVKNNFFTEPIKMHNMSNLWTIKTIAILSEVKICRMSILWKLSYTGHKKQFKYTDELKDTERAFLRGRVGLPTQCFIVDSWLRGPEFDYHKTTKYFHLYCLLGYT